MMIFEINVFMKFIIFIAERRYCLKDIDARVNEIFIHFYFKSAKMIIEILSSSNLEVSDSRETRHSSEFQCLLALSANLDELRRSYYNM